MSSSRTRSVQATVDRLEGSMAVLDAERVSLQVPLAWLPAGVREGDGIVVTFARGDAHALEESVRDRLAKLTKG